MTKLGIPRSKLAGAARRLITTVMRRHFGRGADVWLAALFATVHRAYTGQHADFRACRLPFHNFTHACETSIATLRLLDGHLHRNAAPALTARDCELAVAAILMHDIGFLQETGDTAPTAAGLTPTHVRRGERFTARLLAGRGLRRAEIRFIQLAIRGTGLNARRPPFPSRRERFLASAVSAGDFIGQMSAPDYPERLAALHTEWTEAARQNHTAPPPSLREIRLHTGAFYREHVPRRLILLFPRGYADAIHANLRRIEQQARQGC